MQTSYSCNASNEIFRCAPKISGIFSFIVFLSQEKWFVFQEARKPSDMTELVKQTAEDNQALMIKLKDLQRR